MLTFVKTKNLIFEGLLEENMLIAAGTTYPRNIAHKALMHI